MAESGIFPELCAPAGGPEQLQAAVAYGADAIFLGGNLSLRANSRGFGHAEVPRAVAWARARGVKIYYVLNILAYDRHLEDIRQTLRRLAAAADPVDALIIADPGVFSLAREIAPHIPVHISTQANTSNTEAARFWRDMGVKRAVLARELPAKSIRSIVRSLPDFETEVFVHGAMCLSVSGKCLLSAYLNDRSGNLGQCTQVCRFGYRPLSLQVEEKLRPGKPLWIAVEDKDYGYFYAPDDLCLVKYIPWFVRAGVTGLKIEGRTKSAGYTARVVDVYASALRDFREGRFRLPEYLQELRHTAGRPLSSGFFLPAGRRVVYEPVPRESKVSVLGKLASREGEATWRLKVKSRFESTEPVCLMLPGLKRPLIRPGEYALEDETGTALTCADSGLEVTFRCDYPQLREGLFLIAQGNNKLS